MEKFHSRILGILLSLALMFSLTRQHMLPG